MAISSGGIGYGAGGGSVNGVYGHNNFGSGGSGGGANGFVYIEWD